MISRRGFFASTAAPFMLKGSEKVLPAKEASKLTQTIIVEIDSKKIAEMVMVELPKYMKMRGLA